MKSKTVIIVAIVVGAILVFAALYFYQKNKAAREAAILKQKQLEALGGVDIEMGVDWGQVMTGVAGAATGIAGVIALTQEEE